MRFGIDFGIILDRFLGDFGVPGLSWRLRGHPWAPKAAKTSKRWFVDPSGTPCFGAKIITFAVIFWMTFLMNSVDLCLGRLAPESVPQMVILGGLPGHFGTLLLGTWIFAFLQPLLRESYVFETPDHPISTLFRYVFSTVVEEGPETPPGSDFDTFGSKLGAQMDPKSAEKRSKQKDEQMMEKTHASVRRNC